MKLLSFLLSTCFVFYIIASDQEEQLIKPLQNKSDLSIQERCERVMNFIKSNEIKEKQNVINQKYNDSHPGFFGGDAGVLKHEKNFYDRIAIEQENIKNEIDLLNILPELYDEAICLSLEKIKSYFYYDNEQVIANAKTALRDEYSEVYYIKKSTGLAFQLERLSAYVGIKKLFIKIDAKSDGWETFIIECKQWFKEDIFDSFKKDISAPFLKQMKDYDDLIKIIGNLDGKVITIKELIDFVDKKEKNMKIMMQNSIQSLGVLSVAIISALLISNVYNRFVENYMKNKNTALEENGEEEDQDSGNSWGGYLKSKCIIMLDVCIVIAGGYYIATAPKKIENLLK
jgi:hypothetical protein